ncbi:ATP-binding cassette domain-containing protein [Actinomadura sp. 1N219]|uniref:ATP-binding cassette domain-containing protein n=1 Tax=Actinomadura sp. 1N219 TaxID=3375152 RepID=UPI0037B63771
MIALSVRNLTKSFGGRPVVRDVSFDLNAGEVLGLVGESGSGKSTIARCVARLTRPDSGEIRLGDADLLGASRRGLRTLRRDVQMVFQDPYSSLNPRMTAGALIEEGLLVHGIEPDRRARRERAVALLETVGLSAADAVRHPRSFSGGQRQRIAIARALAVEPKVLICDEVVSSLDVSVQAQVLDLFLDLRERLDLSILFIAHDLAVVHYLCDRVAVLDQGSLVEIGARKQIYGDPVHPYTRSLLDAVPIPDPAAERARLTTP